MTSKIVKTKTFWGGIAAIATGVGLCFAGDMVNGPQTIIAGVLAIFLRDSVAKIEAAR